VLSTSAFVKRDVGTNLFTPGKEYVYGFSLSATAGSNDFISFGSVFNITGDLHVNSNGNTLNVKLDNLLLGTYNGERDLLNPIAYAQKANAKLNPLTEAFQVQVESGKVCEPSLEQFQHTFRPQIPKKLNVFFS
jgi:hypothetical protein